MKTIFSLKIFKIIVYLQATCGSFVLAASLDYPLLGASLIFHYRIIENFLFIAMGKMESCFWFSIKWVIYLVRGAYTLIWKSGTKFLNGSICVFPVTGHSCLGKCALPLWSWVLRKSVALLALEERCPTKLLSPFSGLHPYSVGSYWQIRCRNISFFKNEGRLPHYLIAMYLQSSILQ